MLAMSHTRGGGGDAQPYQSCEGADARRNGARERVGIQEDIIQAGHIPHSFRHGSPAWVQEMEAQAKILMDPEGSPEAAPEVEGGAAVLALQFVCRSGEGGGEVQAQAIWRCCSQWAKQATAPRVRDIWSMRTCTTRTPRGHQGGGGVA